jgi:hypothetical protein
MSGDYPGNARRRDSLLMVVPPEPEVTIPPPVSIKGGDKTADPTAIRPALAQLAAENLDGLQRALLDAALSATTTRWATVACTECGTRSRVELPVPDVRSRLQAIETLLAQGLGRPGEAEEPTASRMPENVSAVKDMGWQELQYVFATTFVDELADLRRNGGEALLQERLERLSIDERRVLREALS